MPAQRKKLYFDIHLTSFTTAGELKTAIMPLTAGASSAAVGGATIVTERNGDFLAAFAALTASSTAARRKLNEIEAIFIPTHTNPLTGRGAVNVLLDFIGSTGAATAIAYQSTVGGGGAVAAKAGNSAVFSTNVRLRMRAWGAFSTNVAVNTLRGVIIAQREHSMDI